MKRKNGFTLIELLAVIIILAVIALIAVPQIIKILNKARLSAAEDTTYGITKAAESYIADFMLKNDGVIPNIPLEFECSEEGCKLTTTLTGYDLTNLEKIDFKGTKPSTGTVKISENGKTVTATNLKINGFICSYENETATCEGAGSEETTTTTEANATPSGYAQSKNVLVNFEGSGVYLIQPSVDVTTNVPATLCTSVDAEYSCTDTVITAGNSLTTGENVWYKVESNPTITFTNNGSLRYKIIDGTNMTEVGSINVDGIDIDVPETSTFEITDSTANSITVKASGTDTESGIYGYQFSKDGGSTWEPVVPQESEIYTFNDLTAGTYTIKIRAINNTYVNNGINELNTLESTTTSSQTVYTLSYNVNGGTGSISSQTALSGKGTTVTTTKPTKTGYNFLGWSMSNTATTATYTGNESITLSSDITLYAVWEKDKEKLPNQTYTSGEAVTLADYNWHVLGDDGTNVTLLMDAGQITDRKHCTEDKDATTDCGTNGKSYVYSWDKSLIRKYLNEVFYLEISNKISNEIIATEICAGPSRRDGVTTYGGYLKSEINAISGASCNNGYVTDYVRLISNNEYTTLKSNVSDTTWLYSRKIGIWWGMGAFSGNSESDRVRYARTVIANGGLNYNYGQTANGVRPVITIRK